MPPDSYDTLEDYITAEPAWLDGYETALDRINAAIEWRLNAGEQEGIFYVLALEWVLTTIKELRNA